MQYSFQYTVLSIQANLEGNQLKVKQGIRTFEMAVSEIQMMWAGKMPPGDFQELVIVTRNSAGKEKKFRFYANDGEQGLKDLVDEIARQRPSADLRSLSREEAFAKMKTADTAKIAFWAVPFIIVAVMAGGASPLLIHGLDKGSAVVSADDLKEGNKTGTRNLVVQGQALNQGLEETTTRKGTKTVRMYFPVVSQGYQEGQPVHVLVQTGDLSEQELSDVLSRTEFKGVLRDILWEGPSGKQIDFFKSQYSLSMADDVKLLELDASTSADLYIYLAILGITLIIMIVVMIIMKRQMN
jgi:hypothetical protein